MKKPLELKLWINGAWQTSAQKPRSVTSPFDSSEVASIHYADKDQLEAAIAAADAARKPFSRSPRWIRAKLLNEMAREIERRSSEFTERMVLEAGKPMKLAQGEVSRAITTFSYAAEEARRFGGEVIPFDGIEAAESFEDGICVWVPRGPVLGIAPFNFPLNLVAHKVAPALACGAPILIKPSHQAPGCAVLLAEIFEQAWEVCGSPKQIPISSFQVLSAENDVISEAIEDSRISILSFTGSDRVGWMLQTKAKKKKVFLELGGNAATIVHQDADLKRAAARIVYGAFAYAGQACISVQNVFAHDAIAAKLQELVLRETSRVKSGNPAESDVLVGPVIDSAAAERILSWIESAKKVGGRLLCGGSRIQGSLLEPTVMADVPSSEKLSCQEVFGPVLMLNTYRKFQDAIESVNASRFGLQVGVFTQRNDLIHEAFRELEVGGVLVNEIPTFRSDPMPYGGVKDSGLGREGLRYAMEEFCERRTLISHRSGNVS